MQALLGVNIALLQRRSAPALALLALVLLAMAGASTAQTATYAIDPSHTFVTFEAKHFGVSTSRGRWDKKEGSIRYDKTAKTGRAEIVLDMASITTAVAPFDGRLKGPDFFDVANHPSATFIGQDFKFDGDKVTEVSGELTLIGKTLPMTLKATSFGCYTNTRIQREVCGGDFEAMIQRSLWGMTNGVAAKTVPDHIRLVIQVEAIKTTP
jgi:polyisoprenoid-binding protein YceI